MRYYLLYYEGRLASSNFYIDSSFGSIAFFGAFALQATVANRLRYERADSPR